MPKATQLISGGTRTWTYISLYYFNHFKYWCVSVGALGTLVWWVGMDHRSLPSFEPRGIWNGVKYLFLAIHTEGKLNLLTDQFSLTLIYTLSLASWTDTELILAKTGRNWPGKCVGKVLPAWETVQKSPHSGMQHTCLEQFLWTTLKQAWGAKEEEACGC